AGRKALEGDPLARQWQPPLQQWVIGKGRQQGAIRDGDVSRIPRQRQPAEWPLAFAEQWAEVGRHESRVGERVGEPPGRRLTAQVVAVVEDLDAGPQEP